MGRYSGDPRTVGEIIAQEKRASIKRKKDFPSELMDKTLMKLTGWRNKGTVGRYKCANC